MLTSPLRSSLSGAGETALLWQNGLLGAPTVHAGALSPGPSVGSVAEQGSAQPAGGRDIKVNAPPFPSPASGETLPNCNTQNEVSLAQWHKRVVAAWIDGGQCDYLGRPGGFSLAGYAYSGDGGATWTDGGVVAPIRARGPGQVDGTLFGDPVLAADFKGNFYYASLASLPSQVADRSPATTGRGRSIIGVAKSTDGGKSWSQPVDASPGRALFAFQDKPWIAVDTTPSKHRGNVYVAWTEFTDAASSATGEDAQKMLFSRSIDGGKTFLAPQRLDTDVNPSREGHQRRPGLGTQVAVGPEGEVYVVWIDPGRSLWFVRSFDGGESFSAPVEIARANPVGHFQACGRTVRPVLDGDIRIDSFPSLAVDLSHSRHRGSIYIAMAHRTIGNAKQDESDVALVYSPDGGATWARVTDIWKNPELIYRDDTGTDQFHPQVAVDDKGSVLVSWYDRRNSVADENPFNDNLDMDVYASVSRDGGATFDPIFRVSDVMFPTPQTNPNSDPGLAACYMGEYNGMVSPGAGEFLVAWGDNRERLLGIPGAFPDPNVYLDRVEL